ncbi:hypothetical protein LshimejAT787_1400940 [Lyophyllum shimeji]|uniref:Uncharacterized protein n=1 Tax=Lyophyllum shimeji TaxID=47721 RepID=A0A9P3PVA8_LYOSH|nr:hypothetical protein LshimejAT787_1400940 [Lyophyllum shimeji]
MAPVGRTSWRRQTGSPAENNSSKPAGGPRKATEGNHTADSPTPSTSTGKSSGVEASPKGGADPNPTSAVGDAGDETPAVHDATSAQAAHPSSASQEVKSAATKELEAPTTVDIPASTTGKPTATGITSISRPTSITGDDDHSSAGTLNSPPAEITSTPGAATSPPPVPVTTPVAAPLTTKVGVPSSLSAPIATSGPSPVPSGPGNSDGTPAPNPPTSVPAVTSPPAPPGNGQESNAPTPPASAPTGTLLPSPVGGGLGNGHGDTSTIVNLPPSTGTGIVTSSSAVSAAPPTVASTTSGIPAPPGSAVTGVPTIPGSIVGGNGDIPSATAAVPTPATTLPDAPPTATETHLVTDINNGAAGPQITSLPAIGVKESAIAGSGGDVTSFTEIPFTTNTIVSTSETTFTSGNRVFTSSITFLSTQVLSTKVPVPTNGVIAGIGDSSASKKTGAMIGGGIGAAIIVLAAALCALFMLRRRRRREQELRVFLSAATPEPFFSPPLHSASPPPPPPQSGSRLMADGPYAAPTNNGAPAMTQTTQSKGPTITSVRKKPVPFLEFPLKRPLSTLASSSMSLNPVEAHPVAADTPDPFADPARNDDPFEDPPREGVPALVLLPATPVNETFRGTSSVSSERGSAQSDSGTKEVREPVAVLCYATC